VKTQAKEKKTQKPKKRKGPKGKEKQKIEHSEGKYLLRANKQKGLEPDFQEHHLDEPGEGTSKSMMDHHAPVLNNDPGKLNIQWSWSLKTQ
jgi:hypothetical protein